MRRLVRGALPRRTSTYLARKQGEVNGGKDGRTTWKAARGTKTMRAVAEELGRMTGIRQRCMFCEDSRGIDIDHYRPLARYPMRCFVWENLLWLCAGCNRLKGDRFDLDGANQPLLIDPTTEDPWDFLFYDSHTGVLTGKYNPATAQPHPKGDHTTNATVLPLNIEAVTEGRRRTQRNLRRAVQHFLASIAQGAPAAAEDELLQALADNDSYGLAKWFFQREGNRDSPFAELRQRFPDVWQSIIAALR